MEWVEKVRPEVTREYAREGQVVEREIVEREVIERPINRERVEGDCEVESGTRGIEVPDRRERFDEYAIVKEHDREKHWARFHAKNTIRRNCETRKGYINYSAIDRHLQNEIVVHPKSTRFKSYK